jgi:hypothetical protein
VTSHASRSRILLLTVLSLCSTGCHSRDSSAPPRIEFTKIPPAAEGGRERVTTISGRVIGAQPGQQIVLYAKSGPWWVQPWPDQPFSQIQSDSTWTLSTHLGFEYAALLVAPGYQPPATMDAPPAVGAGVIAVASVKGEGFLPTPWKSLHFSGYDWEVRTIASDRGGMNNPYSGDNAFTDASGALHMRISKKDGKWVCAEMRTTRSLGYGTYVLTVRDTAHLEPASVFSMITWDDNGDTHYREMDIEISRWGDAANKNNAQFGVQPFYVPGNLARFTAPAGTLTHVFRWESGLASFKTLRGSLDQPGAPVIFQHDFTSGVPAVGNAIIYVNFYVVASEKSPLEKETEVVVEKFTYLP